MMVGGSYIGSATYAALVVFLPLALQEGLCGLVCASTGGGELDPNILIGADSVLNDGAIFAGASRAFLLLDDDWHCGSC
jgi:hypothetical protein